MDNPYIVTKQEHVKIHQWGNTTDGIVILESEYPEVTFYYVGTDDDRLWHRFLTEQAALDDTKWLNKCHNRILELSNGLLYI